MATTSKALVRTRGNAFSQTLYSVPAATTAIITNIVISNASASPTSAALRIITDGEVYAGSTPTLIPTVTIPANTFISVDLKQVLNENETITGNASQGDFVTFHISGVEIN